MSADYRANKWYWQVGDRIYSSAAGAWISSDDPAYLAWLADDNVPTCVPTDDDVVAVQIGRAHV